MALCTEVLEQLIRRQGEELIQPMEKTAHKQVIITTSVGKYRQLAFEGNPFQPHRGIWSPAELNGLDIELEGLEYATLAGMTG